MASGAGLTLETRRGPLLTRERVAGGAGLELGKSGILFWTGQGYEAEHAFK